VFRNGQLLNNDQYSISDTNKITIVSTSFKSGANYTVATVSGIGSVSSAQANPIYPEAGIALSTGTTWTTSITNNSSNWNTAYTDRLKWDGGSTGLVAATGRTSLGGTTIGQSMFTLTNPSAITFPQFNVDNSVTALSSALFRSAIGAGTVTSVTVSGTSGNPLSITNTTTTPIIELLSATTARNGYLTSTDWNTFNNKQSALSNASTSVSGILTSTDWNTFNNKQNTITLTTTGTSGASTLVGSTLNIPQYTGGSGTVTSVSGTGAISVATGTTTPVISIADAAFGIPGIISSGAQQFSGDKTFEGISQFNARAVFKDYTYLATRLAGLSSTDRFATVTIGTGLSLTSGTLSATGGSGTVTEVTGTLPISVTNGTTTPAITIANASTSAAGVVTTGTQSFVGSKTFTGLVGFQRAIQRPYESVTVSSASITTSSTWVVVNNAGTVTLTFPSAAASTGTEFHIKTITNNSVISASSNIAPLAGGSASTAILSATAGKWATLVSDGTNWVIMQAN
jgi:hypothetical protein